MKKKANELGTNPQTQTFTYDALDRLASAVAIGGTRGTYNSQSYTYSTSTGNLSSKAGVSLPYGDTNHDHAVTAMDSNTYGYDTNGNQTSRNISGSSYTLTGVSECATWNAGGIDGKRVGAQVIGVMGVLLYYFLLCWHIPCMNIGKYYGLGV